MTAKDLAVFEQALDLSRSPRERRLATELLGAVRWRLEHPEVPVNEQPEQWQWGRPGGAEQRYYPMATPGRL